ncbi:MAG: hypothetical protein GXP41_05620 [Chloroflexi bacterium]|nr:hypothetical protein [Chloroflexota bacterium]
MGYTLFGAIAGFIAGWALHWYWTRGRADIAAGEFDRTPGGAANWEETPLVDRSIAEEIADSAEEEPAEEEGSEGVPVPVPAADSEAEASGDSATEEPETAYCMRCREHRSVEGLEHIVTENGRHAIRGTCGVCGGKVFKFVRNPG